MLTILPYCLFLIYRQSVTEAGPGAWESKLSSLIPCLMYGFHYIHTHTHQLHQIKQEQ